MGKNGGLVMKQIVIIGLIVCLSGCGIVSDLFDDAEDNINDALTALASGDISFLKEDMKQILGEDVVDCANHASDIAINVYQASEIGEMSLQTDKSSILDKESTEEACNYSYEIKNLNSGLTTIETIMKKKGAEKQIVQRLSDSLEENKTNVLTTITRETTEIADRVIPIILEKYTDEIETIAMKKLGDAQLKIYVNLIKDTVKETIATLKKNHAFTSYDVTSIKPISEEFFDLETQKINLEKYKNSSLTRHDLDNIKNSCKNDSAGKNYIDMIELDYNIKHNRNDAKYAKTIIEEVFGEEMIENHPAAVELMADAYKDDDKVTLEDMADAIFEAMNFSSAKTNGDITIEEVPLNSTQILEFMKAEITQEEGLIHNVFDDYEDTNKTYRDRYSHTDYQTSHNRDALMTTKGIRTVFSEEHRWNNITEVNNNEKLDILEIWTLIKMAMDEGQLHEDYFDMSKFFYTLGILDMDKAFVVDIFIEKDEDKELIISIVDTQNKIVKLKASIQLSNDTSTKVESIEISNPNIVGYDKEFNYNLATFETGGYMLKSGEIKVELLDVNNNIINTHKQDLLDFSDMFQKSDHYDDYYETFEYSDSNEIEEDIINESYVQIKRDHPHTGYGNTISTQRKEGLSIKGNNTLKDKIPENWIFQEGESIHYFLDENLMRPLLENDYLDQYEVIFEYKIKEVIKPIDLNNDITELHAIKSYYDTTETIEWNHFKYQSDHPEKLKLASRIVAEGTIDSEDSLEVILPLLEPNRVNEADNYYLHYKLCVRHIILNKKTEEKVNKNKFKCFPYFIEPVDYTIQ
tara:strand:- start:1144 stop:3564 length:2421 start_codon:yes stop_codon:yes gene_type:complete